MTANPIRTHWIDIAPGFAGYLALPPAGRGCHRGGALLIGT